MALAMATKPATYKKKKKIRVFWHDRPPESNTNIIQEFQARGFSAAFMLYNAKAIFRKNQIAILKKISKKLHREENDVSILRNLYAHASNEGKAPNAAMAFVIGTWLARQEKMTQLHEYTRDWLPEDSLPIFRAGEASGRRAEALDQYIWILEKKLERKKMFMSKLTSPAINVTIMIIYLIIIARYVVPGFAQALPEDQWTGTLLVTKIIADAINNYLIPIGIGIAAFVFFSTWSLNNYIGKYRKYLEKYFPIPIWFIFKQSIGANFMMSYAALNKTAMPENTILETLIQDAPKYYKSRLVPAQALTAEGEHIPNALQKTGLEFPDREIIIELLSYQDTDDFSQEIEYLAKEWINNVIIKIAAAITTIDMTSIALAYALLLLITLADFTFMQAVQEYMKGSSG